MTGARNVSVLQIVNPAFGAHPTAYSIVTVDVHTTLLLPRLRLSGFIPPLPL